ncbi:MAG: hypothetical protein K8S23_07175 [Candidatus Cloacimonetes bacterium]|nr:hypothetical protein [Candidatus Cloacimonadota bacterium]
MKIASNTVNLGRMPNNLDNFASRYSPREMILFLWWLDALQNYLLLQ